MRIDADTAIVYRNKKTGEIEFSNAFHDMDGNLRCMGTLMGRRASFVKSANGKGFEMLESNKEFLFTHPLRTVRGAISRWKKEQAKAEKARGNNGPSILR